MAPIVVLVTGANRGLGKGMLQRYLAQPNHIVIAANRDPAHPTSQALSELPKGEGSRLIVVKLDASSEEDSYTAVKELQEDHGIDHLDVAIANAGISHVWPSVATLKVADLQTHMEVNAYGVLWLYQATRSMLQKSTREPIFAPVGSVGGCMGRQPPFPNAAYGPSKAVVNWLTVRINAEDDWLNAFILTPGLVDTELGATGARALGIEQFMMGLDECCDGMKLVMDSSAKEKNGGKMVMYTGEISGW